MRKKPRKRRSKRALAFKPGERVIIVRSWHSDIPTGARGTISKRLDHGYAVDVPAAYGSAANRNERIVETRRVFFAHEELEREPPLDSLPRPDRNLLR
jgi:hypothetical protein